MGYPQFNKITIQLPLPDLTMTKAEYKAAYGIDLDTINFPKVTLLVDGVNKYPVDEIKIVSDDVLIFAGGKILTIGDNGNVSVTSNAYSVENAKPLYFHPVSLYASDGSIYITSIIINNDPTPYDIDTFFAQIFAWGDGARLLITGGDIYALNANVSFNPAYIKELSGKLYYFGVDSTGVVHNDTTNPIEFKKTDFAGCADSVNKIN